MEPYIIGLFIFSGVVAAILVLYHIIKAFKNNNYNLVVIATAKVITTYEEYDQIKNRTVYYIEFKLRNGDMLKFSVKKKVFINIAEGQKGEIRYKGEKFIKFIKEINDYY